MTIKGSRPVTAPGVYPPRRSHGARPLLPQLMGQIMGMSVPEGAWAGRLQRWMRTVAPRALMGVALVLVGAVAGLAAGQSIAKRSAHRAGACSALNMAAALGYLDAEQQRRVSHALGTALNPDVDLFSGGRPGPREACDAGAGG